VSHFLGALYTYISKNGDIKEAAFQLDGYDAEKKIGYKLITLNDKALWEQERKNGNQEAPDLNDYELIQSAAIEYENPIFLIKIYEYQNQIDNDSIRKNQNKFFADLYKLLGTQRMVQWLEGGLYNGEWIKAGLEESMKSSGLNFSHNDLPMVDLYYGDNHEAVFSLDGYDTKMQVGYKFITDEDAIRWNDERRKGNNKAPDLTESVQIKEAALKYKFPVLFIYYPEYWKSDISSIYNQELAGLFILDSYIYKWLENHK